MHSNIFSIRQDMAISKRERLCSYACYPTGGPADQRTSLLFKLLGTLKSSPTMFDQPSEDFKVPDHCRIKSNKETCNS